MCEAIYSYGVWLHFTPACFYSPELWVVVFCDARQKADRILLHSWISEFPFNFVNLFYTFNTIDF